MWEDYNEISEGVVRTATGGAIWQKTWARGHIQEEMANARSRDLLWVKE